MKPKISIIVPIYNVEKYLDKCLKSLVNQTLEEIEIILINDGSTDNSKKVIEKYLKDYNDKIIYIEKENEGQGTARNIGIGQAKGKYVTFVDSDDWIENTMLEELYEIAKKEKSDIVACTSYMEELPNESKIIHYQFDDNNDYKKYILNNPGPCGKIIKTDIIKNNKLYFPKLRAYEDIAVVPIWGIKANKISFVDKPHYHYLMRTGSTMKQITFNEKLLHIYQSLDILYNNFNHKNKELYSKELEWIYIENLLHAASLRFFKFQKISEIKKINKIMKQKFPKWKKNKYYLKQNIKYKIVCNLFYKEKYKILKLILK